MGIATVVLVALAGCETETGTRVGAYEACERAVEASLKAPSTAEFSGYSSATVTNDGDRYVVQGYVDAANGFGAQIRTDFTCTVRDTGDNWELVTLRGV